MSFTTFTVFSTSWHERQQFNAYRKQLPSFKLRFSYQSKQCRIIRMTYHSQACWKWCFHLLLCACNYFSEQLNNWTCIMNEHLNEHVSLTLAKSFEFAQADAHRHGYSEDAFHATATRKASQVSRKKSEMTRVPSLQAVTRTAPNTSRFDGFKTLFRQGI